MNMCLFITILLMKELLLVKMSHSFHSDSIVIISPSIKFIRILLALEPLPTYRRIAPVHWERGRKVSLS